MAQYVCIHGHFYQPPREDPQTGKIPNQPSAAPFDNWNDQMERMLHGEYRSRDCRWWRECQVPQ